MAKKTVQEQVAEMMAVLADYMPKLLALMPSGRRINGDPDGEMHLSMSDFNSCEAARVTLEKYGYGVDVYSVPEPTQWFIHFADRDVGRHAIKFYNRLPRNMKNYVPKRTIDGAA